MAPSNITTTGQSPTDPNDLRVLVVHARYRSVQQSGENEVVDEETRLLRERGCVVEPLEMRSDDIEEWSVWRKAGLPFRVVWSIAGQRDLQRALDRFRPNVVHVHNTFPLFSPAIFRTARGSRAAVVHTLHNFRPLCPAGTFLRDSKPCEDCLGRFPLPAVRHACYRGSRMATAPVALMDGVHGALKTWQRCVDRFIVLSDFARSRYVRAGWPSDKMRIKFNTVDGAGLPSRRPGRHFLSMSRLGSEKGVDVLLEGWHRAFPSGEQPLLIAGGGEKSAELRGRYGDLPGVDFLGRVERPALNELLATARALVVPSRWYECFPRVIAEAYAAGVPVVASDIGSLAELVDDHGTGLLVRVEEDPDDMSRALRELAGSVELCDQLGRQARASYERAFSPAVTMRVLFDVYREAIEERTSRGP